MADSIEVVQLLCQRIGLSEEEKDIVLLAAEFYRKSSQQGSRLLKVRCVSENNLFMNNVIIMGVRNVIAHSRDSWNGSSHPGELSGDDIPIGSRIIAIYEKWLCFQGSPDLHRFLLVESGKSLDPDLVSEFLACVDILSKEQGVAG